MPIATVDADQVEHLLDRAFGPNRHERTAYKIRGAAPPIAALSFAAMDDGILIGSIQCWPVALSGTDGGPAPLVMVGPVAVAVRDQQGNPPAPPWPDIAIGCGRRAALLTRALRRWNPGRTFTVQILDPRIATTAFDVVIAPQHDAIDGANLIRSIGALNPVDPRWLAVARTRFAMLAALPAPRTALLVGGSNRAQQLDRAYFDALLERLAAHHAWQGGSFMVSMSRRTPVALVARLRSVFAEFPGVFWSGATDGDNPYAGYLAWADRIVVTPDSVNMLSEAAATGKPLYTFAARPVTGKLAAFHAELVASGHLRRLDGGAHPPQPAPLAETAAIA